MKYFRDIAFGSNAAIEYARKLENDCDKYLDIIQAKNMNESFLESEIMSLKKQLELERLEKEKAIKEAEVLMLTLEIDEGSPMDVWLKKYGSKK